MIKKEIYPKTKRIPNLGDVFEITEKLDGSNITFFKKDEQLYIAQRRLIFAFDEFKDIKDKLYKGEYEFLEEYGDFLKNSVCEGNAICCEWLGMGQLKYNSEEFPNRVYMFAKAEINDDFTLYNFNYSHDTFKWAFEEQEIPSFIGVVPEVACTRAAPNKEILDALYDAYSEKCSNRKVEGFVINYNNVVRKYVRMSNGKLVDYNESYRKKENC